MTSTAVLALPAPSLDRHLVRTIDGRSLTGIPGADNTNISRKPWRAPRQRKTSWKRMSARSRQQLQAALKTCKGHLVREQIPHPDATLWAVASVHDGFGLSLSYVWAINKETAINAHHEINVDKGIYSTFINIAALQIGTLN